MKTLLGHTPRARAWRVRLGHMTTPSSPFNQHPPRRSSAPPGAQLASPLAKRRCSRGCSRNPCREAATGLRPWWR